jgi:glycosyltransferase involved in cell wall biosynthesis
MSSPRSFLARRRTSPWPYLHERAIFDVDARLDSSRAHAWAGADAKNETSGTAHPVPRMRLLCVIPALGTLGGAQKVMAYVASKLAEQHDVTLLTLEPAQTPLLCTVSPLVRLVQLDLLGGDGLFQRTKRILERFAAIRRQINRVRPHAVLSFMDTMNMTTILSSIGSGAPIVISERVDPSHHQIGSARKLLRWLLYPLADCCVVQTNRVKSYFDHRARPKIAVIANPVRIPVLAAKPNLPSADGRFRIIALGRLDRQKGFDLLVEAFARLADTFLDWDVVIFGDGPERQALERLIASNRLEARVHLAGITQNSERELAASHLLAFPSRFEGFPNALAEGMAAGLPAIGHGNVSGVEEMIIHNKTGLLVDRTAGPDGLANSLRSLMVDPQWRVELGAQARRHMERWSPNEIVQRWEACLCSVASNGRANGRS